MYLIPYFTTKTYGICEGTLKQSQNPKFYRAGTTPLGLENPGSATGNFVNLNQEQNFCGEGRGVSLYNSVRQWVAVVSSCEHRYIINCTLKKLPLDT